MLKVRYVCVHTRVVGERCDHLNIWFPLTGIKKTIKLMKHLEVKFTGIEYYFLAKAHFTALLNQHGRVRSQLQGINPARDRSELSVDRNEEETRSEATDLTLENLSETLEACKESYAISVDCGSRALYLVNGVLLSTPVSQCGVYGSYQNLRTLRFLRTGWHCLQSWWTDWKQMVGWQTM